MNITFDDKDLKKYANDDKLAIRKLGPKRAKLYKLRLDDLLAAETLEDTRFLPGTYHELTSNRKGQWSCYLDNPYRLIFTPQEKPIPVDSSGKYIWSEIKGIKIIEIENYHKQ